MLAWTPRFKAVFVTIHLPLAYVNRHVTPDTVAEKAVLLDAFLRREAAGVKHHAGHPRICCLAFNPHGREFTRGEENWIADGVAIACKAGVDAYGPVPADAALAHIENWDGFVAMYHDQAMIPAKLLAHGRGVNATLGLGRIRTSPLHGTAFDIAGKGKADPRSMLEAIRLARKLARVRPA
jgi:4-hydroxythreonine-4-phosphate dehydrogenase